MHRISAAGALAAVLASAPDSALANVVWPEIYFSERLVDWWVIAAGLVIEFFFLWWLYRLPLWKTLAADVVANAVSALFGALVLPWIGLLREFLLLPFALTTFRWPNLTAAIILILAANVTLEGLVYKYAFKLPLGRRNVAWLAVANAISVGVMIYSYWRTPGSPFG
jgi:hypothetical protein